MDIFLTTQFIAGCGFILVPFAVLAGVTEAALRVILPIPRRTP